MDRSTLSSDDLNFELKLTYRFTLLISHLFFTGLTEEMLNAGWDMSVFVDDLPESAIEGQSLHAEVFLHQLPPFMSIFVSATQYPDLTIREQIVRRYKSYGVDGLMQSNSSVADHIGALLNAFTALIEQQVDALEQGDEPGAKKIGQRSQQLLRESILPWLPPFYLALTEVSPGFYAQWLEMFLLRIQTEGMLPKPGLQRSFVKPFDAISDPETGMRQIREWLLVPSRCGVYLTPKMLRQMGSILELPSGFGRREEMLDNLLRSAGEYDKLDEILALLVDHFADCGDLYEQLMIGFPGLSPYIKPWLEATDQSIESLTKMEEAYRGS
jgi:hypothetical protein